MIPGIDLERVRRWAATRAPVEFHEQLRMEVDVSDRALTVVECRPPWRADLGPEWTRHPVARLRYTKVRNEWSLYWFDKYSDAHEYDLLAPSENVQDLLDEVDRDPTSIFWG